MALGLSPACGGDPTNNSTQTNTSSTAGEGWLAGAEPDANAPQGSSVYQWGTKYDSWTDFLRITAGRGSIWGNGYFKDHDGTNGSSRVAGSAKSAVDITLSMSGDAWGFIVVTNNGSFEYKGSLKVGDWAKLDAVGHAKDIQGDRHDCDASEIAMREVTSTHRQKETEEHENEVGAPAESSATGTVSGYIRAKRESRDTSRSERTREYMMPPGTLQPFEGGSEPWVARKWKVGELPISLVAHAEAFARMSLSAKGLGGQGEPRPPAAEDGIVELSMYDILQEFGYEWGTWDPAGLREPTDPLPPSPNGTSGDPNCDEDFLEPVELEPVELTFVDARAGSWPTPQVRVMSVHSGLGYVGCGYPAVAFEPAVLRIELEDPADEEMTFDITTDPAGATDLPDALVIPAGHKSGCAFYTPQVSGCYTITSELLDPAGDPTGDAQEVETCAIDPASETAPKLRSYWNAERSLNPFGLSRIASDVTLPAIMVGRTAFDDAATEATVVEVTVTDTNGVLESLPSTVTIPAGDYVAALDVELTGSTGVAQVKLSLDGEDVVYDFEVVSRKLVFRTPEIDASAGTTVRGAVAAPRSRTQCTFPPSIIMPDRSPCCSSASLPVHWAMRLQQQDHERTGRPRGGPSSRPWRCVTRLRGTRSGNGRPSSRARTGIRCSRRTRKG